MLFDSMQSQPSFTKVDKWSFLQKGFKTTTDTTMLLFWVVWVGASNAGQPNVSKVLMMSQSKWFLQIKI
jgi:hypothetical protein